MLDGGKISAREYADALNAPLPKPDDVRLPGTEGPAQYFVNYVKQQLIDRTARPRSSAAGCASRRRSTSGCRGPPAQPIAKWLTEPDGPVGRARRDRPARTASVLAMVGGRNYRESQFNLAVQGKRQPGSSFKPFVLATALRQGIAPCDAVRLEAADDRARRQVLVRLQLRGRPTSARSTSSTATIDSDNAVYAQLTRSSGRRRWPGRPSASASAASSNGYFAIGLGVEAVNPLELARAYATFANGGRRDRRRDGRQSPARVREGRTRTAGGRRFNARRPETRPEPDAGGDPQLDPAEGGQPGDRPRAALPSRPVAGKTGTTENYGDAWFVGYTPQLVVAIWVGYPESCEADADRVPRRRRSTGGTSRR